MNAHDLKRIVCLANSRKLSGRYIAGRELIEGQGPGDWVRLVSARENQEVSEYERQYEDGSDPRVLDIIDIPILERQPPEPPQQYQTENWVLDPGFYWKKAGVLPRRDLPDLLDPITPLWIDGQSTYHGLNDRIWLELADSVSDSLRLIHVERLSLEVFKPGEAFGSSKRRVQGQFTHRDKRYGLWVTDPGYERQYLAKLDGTYEIGECFLTISLGEPHEGWCYKLIAAIIPAE